MTISLKLKSKLPKITTKSLLNYMHHSILLVRIYVYIMKIYIYVYISEMRVSVCYYLISVHKESVYMAHALLVNIIYICVELLYILYTIDIYKESERLYIYCSKRNTEQKQIAKRKKETATTTKIQTTWKKTTTNIAVYMHTHTRTLYVYRNSILYICCEG